MSKQAKNIIIGIVAVAIAVIAYLLYANMRIPQAGDNQQVVGQEKQEENEEAAKLSVYSHPTLGSILADDKGMILYLYTKDEGAKSACYGQCAVAWPPLLTKGAPAGTGIDTDRLGTTERDDGSTQVTYDGKPLYYYIKDVNPGDATGEAVGGVWYVIKP
jgi:predicted lipoprotein with Yx(FWY)xxD motif